MPTTPDRPTGRSAGSGDPSEAAEAEFDLVRDTVPVLTEQPTVRVTDNRETVKLPRQRQAGASRSRAPLPVAAAFATIWAAFLSYVPVAAVIGLARTLEGQGGLGGAMHAGLAGWLLGHGVPIGTSIGSLGLAPLLLTLLAGWRLNRAGLHVTRAIGARRSGSTRAALLVALTIGFIYGVIGLLAALTVDGRGTDVSPTRAGIHFFLAGLVFSLIGSLRSTEALVVIARRIPQPLRHGLRTGVVAAMFILAAGAVFAGLSVAVGGKQAAEMIAAYRTGAAGQAGITLVSLAYGANAAVWAAAYLLGPGFSLGADSAVRLTELTVGPVLPTLPLLAGLPAGPMGASGALLLAVPVLAAMAAGWLLTRRLMTIHHVVDGHLVDGRHPNGDLPPVEPPWPLVLSSAVIAGPIAGLVLGVVSWLSSGPLGDGQLADIGPVPWQVALVAAAVVGVCASIGAAAGRAFRAPVHHNK
ncbi:hypothetical protein GCM10010435_88250 [Winogradskya consettensis]|uniref:Uncharacterized protein n=1 Tax=Winogradskya consettensis TaxID=113560 RepID=A0A919W1X5_9ACTN|nr:DUF6350 family protein [Actinoplanes consettensis]GIM84408.1 hypothetical protein Aco04nite_91260 [Actinoplanes consettensis]